MGKRKTRRVAPPGWEEERKERLRQQRRQKALTEASKHKPHPVTVTKIDGTTEVLQPGTRNFEYQRYIRSPAWAARKVAYYRTHPKICTVCGTIRRIHLHHLTYERMGEELDVDLLPLCETCHDAVHKHYDSGRRSLRLATLEYVNRTKKTFDVSGAEVVAVKRKSPQRNGSRSRGENPRERRTNPRALGAKRDPVNDALGEIRERRRRIAREMEAQAIALRQKTNS